MISPVSLVLSTLKGLLKSARGLKSKSESTTIIFMSMYDYLKRLRSKMNDDFGRKYVAQNGQKIAFMGKNGKKFIFNITFGHFRRKITDRNN